MFTIQIQYVIANVINFGLRLLNLDDTALYVRCQNMIWESEYHLGLVEDDPPYPCDRSHCDRCTQAGPECFGYNIREPEDIEPWEAYL